MENMRDILTKGMEELKSQDASDNTDGEVTETEPETPSVEETEVETNENQETESEED